MTTYAIPNGDGTYRYLDATTSQTFSIGPVSFPSPYLTSASPQALTANGILAVVEPAPPDPTTNVITGNSIELVAGVPTRVWVYTAMTSLQLAQLAFATAINVGINITSTSTSALNGNYSVTTTATANITAVMAGVAAGQGLPGGQSTFGYEDSSGTPHVFTASQFTAFSVAARNYVYALDMFAGGLGAQPSANVTIA